MNTVCKQGILIIKKLHTKVKSYFRAKANEENIALVMKSDIVIFGIIWIGLGGTPYPTL